MKTTVIHHSADFDGIFSREIARKFIPDATLIGWDYGQPKIPMPDGGKVYIIDLSPECLAETPGGETAPFWDRIVWIDHHWSTINKFPDSIPGYRIDGVAACRLAWQFFSDLKDVGMTNTKLLPKKEAYVDRSVTEPIAVRLAGEHDIWDHRDPDAELFQFGLRSRELTPADWDLMLVTAETHCGDLAATVRELLENGKFVRYADQQAQSELVKNAGFTVEFEGLKFLALNSGRKGGGQFTAGVKPDHDGLLKFNYDGKQWDVSLYHATGKEHHDLSTIAVKYGGGGHRGACGFRMQGLLPFLK